MSEKQNKKLMLLFKKKKKVWLLLGTLFFYLEEFDLFFFSQTLSCGSIGSIHVEWREEKKKLFV